MRLPDKALGVFTLLKGPETSGKLIELMSRWQEPCVQGDYLHWDELRRRTPPEGLANTADWWAAIAIARMGKRVQLPLTDVAGLRFWVCQHQGLLKRFHHLDRSMGVLVGEDVPLKPTNELKDSYLASALFEEAITSSQLEGAATTRNVAKEMLLTGRKPATRDERMIANNFAAMQFIRSERGRRPLDLDFLLELQDIVTAGTLDDPGQAGRLRRADEAITVQDYGDGTTLHTPPDAALLPKRLAAMIKFANERDGEPFLHPILRAAALHFALAYEHPFVDGNGRTARALQYWSLLRDDYWLAEFLSISRVIQRAPIRYSRAFLHTETDNADLTYFVTHQLEVLSEAVSDLKKRVAQTVGRAREVDRLLRGDASLNQRQQALLAHALRHPHFHYTIEGHRASHQIVHQTARTDLLALVRLGLLLQKRSGRKLLFESPADMEKRLRRFGRST